MTTDQPPRPRTLTDLADSLDRGGWTEYAQMVRGLAEQAERLRRPALTEDLAAPQPAELLPVLTADATGLDVDQQLRAAALQAAAVWMQATGLHSSQVLDLADTWASWIRDGVR